MEFLTQQQQFVVNSFGNHCKKLIEYGFAYAGAHPEAKEILDCEVRKIRAIERQIRESPSTKNCLDKMLRDANIQYIVKIIKLGMRYVQNNPQCAEIIQDVQKSLNEYDRARQIPKQIQMKIDDDFEFKDVLQKLNEIKATLESIETRTFSLGRPKLEKFRAMKETGNWEKFKQEIDTQLNERRRRLKVRQNFYEQMRTIKEENSDESFENSEESQENSGGSEESQEDLRENRGKFVRSQKYSEQRPKFSRQGRVIPAKIPNYSKGTQEIPYQRQEIPRKCLERQENFEQSPEDSDIILQSPDSDDDENISEVLVNCETYNDPNPSKKSTAKVGRIQRHLFIPVQAETTKAIPKITPKVYFKKENDGSMKFNVKLNFAERVICNDRLVNSINIQNLLPQHKNNHNRR